MFMLPVSLHVLLVSPQQSSYALGLDILYILFWFVNDIKVLPLFFSRVYLFPSFHKKKMLSTLSIAAAASSASPTMICPTRFYFAFDTEGSSPLEVALAAVRDGRICNAMQLILKPEPGRDETYAIANVHGISLAVATSIGLGLERAVDALRCFLLSERANVTPDPEAGVWLFCPGEAPGAGDSIIFERLGLPWLRLHAIAQEPWLSRVQQTYFRDVTSPFVPVCPGFVHAAYAPRQLRAKALRNGTARAKLQAGFHCASHDVVRLVNYISERNGKAEAEQAKEEAASKRSACGIA